VGHAEIDAAAQCHDGLLAIAVIDVPGALPDDGYVMAGGAEFFMFHVFTHDAGGAP
jgi:hypothetical protein